MASSHPTDGPIRPAAWLQVWVEAGRDGQVFSYANPPALAAAVGDLVQVPLRNRSHGGLVLEALTERPEGLVGKRIAAVEAIRQRGALDPHWHALLLQVAHQCHTSPFLMLKTALPPGWLGQRASSAPKAPRQRWRMQLAEPAELAAERSRPLSERQQALVGHLRERGGGAILDELCGTAGFSRSVVRSLEDRGWLVRHPLEAPAGPPGSDAAQPWGLELNPDQAAALGAITAAPAGSSHLLWGVTGAGKTEVYLQAAAHQLARGRSVLLLAPEIGLLPQLLDRCRRRFGGQVLEFHSGLGDAERIRAWRRALAARSGLPLVAVGTRSAVFLPLEPLGLIVLDEEHDTSYKQESPMPCYHARDVARLRAGADGAVLVLGTATPCLETWLDCQGGGTRELRLPERIGSRPLPPVRVVDMRLELAEGHRRLLSRALLGRLEGLQERGEQAVVLVPRRGYSPFLGCRACGEVVQCPHCDVALTVHRSGPREWLRCHWCDHRQEVAPRCGQCGSTAFKPFGAGTQRVLEQLGAELEGLRVLRFDRDTTRGRDGHRRLLEAFAAGEADVLVGTQMLAKGMDLPRVTLAAVLAADGLLHRPDLRAAEHSLQLLLQLAGRAGRGEKPGEVLVQTYSPDHPVIRHLVDGDYGRFLVEEAALRRNGGLVPFSRACLLRLSGTTATETATAATTLAQRIRRQVEAAGWLLIGPAPAPVARVAGRCRWQLLLHGPAGTALPLPPEMELRRGLPTAVGLTIDPDPLQL